MYYRENTYHWQQLPERKPDLSSGMARWGLLQQEKHGIRTPKWPQRLLPVGGKTQLCFSKVFMLAEKPLLYLRARLCGYAVT
jgi:hypothetical protein